MPIKYRKKVTKKRAYKKPVKKSYNRKSLTTLIKKVSLKQCETKNTHNILENLQLFHNSQYILQSNLLSCNQGVGDTNAGTTYNSCRLGDEVIARGISIKLWFANKLDRPNVMYKVMIVQFQSRTFPNDIFFSQGSTNIMLRDFNNEKYKLIYSKTFNCQVGYSAAVTALAGDTDGREAHKFLKIWIPLKNKRIVYDEASTMPRDKDYALVVCCYDSFGTTPIDNIATFAVNTKFYFKDP